MLAVGGGSSIDTAKAVDLLLTNPGELMDYVNAPVGKARSPVNPLLPLVAVPTTTGTGSESTTICVLDVLALKVKTGISHPALRPRLAIVDPLLTAHPAGDGHRRRRDGHPLPRAGELHRALVRRLRRQAARAAGALLRRQPDRRHVVREGADPAGRSRSGRAVRDGEDPAAREQMAMAATFAGLGFGNAGVHIPHANAYPIAGRVRDYRPRGIPRRRADRPARHGGLADRAGGVPVHLRRRTRTGTCARPGSSTRTRRATGPTCCPRCITALMRDIGIPNGLAEVGYGEADVDDLVAGAIQQQRLLATAPRRPRRRTWRGLRRLDGTLVR